MSYRFYQFTCHKTNHDVTFCFMFSPPLTHSVATAQYVSYGRTPTDTMPTKPTNSTHSVDVIAKHTSQTGAITISVERERCDIFQGIRSEMIVSCYTTSEWSLVDGK